MYVDGKFIISGSGGPLLFFDSANASGSGGGGFSVPAFALSAFSHFTSNLVQNCPTTKASRWEDCHLGVNAGAGGCGAQGAVRCQLFDTAAVLLARPGVTRLTRAFGALLRRAKATARARGAGVTQLSYWADNQAGYSWWTAGDDQEIWGKPETIYLKLKEVVAMGDPFPSQLALPNPLPHDGARHIRLNWPSRIHCPMTMTAHDISVSATSAIPAPPGGVRACENKSFARERLVGARSRARARA